MIEPDAWKYRDHAGVNQAVLINPDDHSQIQYRFKEPLYSGESIREQIEKLRDKGIDAQINCENIGRDRALRELKKVFSE